MIVRVSINRMNSGRMQICCARPGGNGHVLTYPAASAKADVASTLRALGVSEGAVTKGLDAIADFGPDEMLLVEQLEIPEGVLQSNGFSAV
jgi:hypothetical protein